MTSSHKRRRDLARERGDCTTCCKRPAQSGSCRCVECNAWRQAMRTERTEPTERFRDLCKERGDCIRCAVRPAAPNRVSCVECLTGSTTRSKLNRKEIYTRRREAGLCAVCESPSGPRWACLACRLDAKRKVEERKQAIRRDVRPATASGSQGRCEHTPGQKTPHSEAEGLR